MSLKIKFRRACHLAHEWLGLASCLLVFVLCLTGSALALQEPIESWVNQGVLKVQPQGQPLPLAQVIAKLPPGNPLTGVILPAGPDEALRFRRGRETTFVNPYTGAVMGPVHSGLREAFMVAFRLHRWLLLDPDWGRPITGAGTLVFLVTLVSGVILWAPGRLAGLGRALRFRRGQKGLGLNRELHVVLGLYAFPFLLVMGVTALFWSYNATFEAVAYRVLDGKPAPAESPRTPPIERPTTALNFPAILATTDRLHPEAGLTIIRFPARADGPVEVGRAYLGEAFRLPRRDELIVHGQTGALIKAEPFADRSRAEALLWRIRDLHTGTLLGAPMVALYLLACLVGTSLPLTGALHWWGKLRARRRAQSLKTGRGAPSGSEAQGALDGEAPREPVVA